MVSVNLVANTDLRTAGRVPPAGRQGAERRRRPARRHCRRRARRRELRRRSALQRTDGDLHGHLGAADRQLARRDRGRCARRCPPSRRSCPADMHGRHPLRRDRVHPGRHRRGAHDADRDAADRRRRDLPVPRLDPRGDHPGRRDPDLADRRGVPDAGVRLHDQPAHAARHRALGRPGGRRRDRGGGERRAAPARGQAAAAGGDRRGARAGRADHRDDDHAGRGLCADRHPGRPDRRAVPRVRLHARRRRSSSRASSR